MDSVLLDLLDLEHPPVGVFYAEARPADALAMVPGKRNCVVDMLLAAARGKKVVVDEESCTCAGGAVGLGFGNAFERRGHPTRYLLSTGAEGVPEGECAALPPHMVDGERFFRDPTVVDVWKAQLPYGDETSRCVVFAAQDLWGNAVPDLVFLLVNPDQLSALVSMGGFRSGSAFETVAPFGAACQSILHAKAQDAQANPKMVMGLFDVSQRARIPANLLSLTMPYRKFAELEEDAAKGCLTSHSWKELVAKREREVGGSASARAADGRERKVPNGCENR